jgi:hypothetical protein
MTSPTEKTNLRMMEMTRKYNPQKRSNERRKLDRPVKERRKNHPPIAS